MRGKDFNTGLRGVLFEARHYERMGAAVWLYGWLVLRQTHQEGSVGWVLGGAPVTYREIEEETGFNPRTLERWMQVLRREGYVHTETVPAGLVIRINKAKKFPQGARKFASRERKFAEPRPQPRGAKCTYGAYPQQLALAISSSFIDRSQENQDMPFLHRDFHNGTVPVENRADALNQNCSGVGENHKNGQNRTAQPFRKPFEPAVCRETPPLDLRFLRQLLRHERDEAVRRELAVGTGPEVPRS